MRSSLHRIAVLALASLLWIIPSRAAEGAPAKGVMMKAVMQMSSTTQQSVIRGLQDALEISQAAQARGRSLDLRIIVCGLATDQFLKGMSPRVRKSFEEVSLRSDVHFFVCAPTLKKIDKGLNDLLPGFTIVSSGSFDVLQLEEQGYHYIKP